MICCRTKKGSGTRLHVSGRQAKGKKRPHQHPLTSVCDSIDKVGQRRAIVDVLNLQYFRNQLPHRVPVEAVQHYFRPASELVRHLKEWMVAGPAGEDECEGIVGSRHERFEDVDLRFVRPLVKDELCQSPGFGNGRSNTMKGDDAPVCHQ